MEHELAPLVVSPVGPDSSVNFVVVAGIVKNLSLKPPSEFEVLQLFLIRARKMMHIMAAMPMAIRWLRWR